MYTREVLVLTRSTDSMSARFTPGCQAYHLPPYLEKIEQLQGKGVDLVVVIASNDAWVMSAWGKVRVQSTWTPQSLTIHQVNGAKEDTKVLFMSDTKTFFSKAHGWSAGPDRNGRWVSNFTWAPHAQRNH